MQKKSLELLAHVKLGESSQSSLLGTLRNYPFQHRPNNIIRTSQGGSSKPIPEGITHKQSHYAQKNLINTKVCKSLSYTREEPLQHLLTGLSVISLSYARPGNILKVRYVPQTYPLIIIAKWPNFLKKSKNTILI